MPNTFPQELFDTWLDAAIDYIRSGGQTTYHLEYGVSELVKLIGDVYQTGLSRVQLTNELLSLGITSIASPPSGMVFNTTYSGLYSLSFGKTGANLHAVWPDASTSDEKSFYHALDGGDQIVTITSPIDGFSGVTTFQSSTLYGPVPSFTECVNLTDFRIWGSHASGTLPSFATCTAISDFFLVQDNMLEGTIPSFETVTGLGSVRFDTNRFTDTVPGSFSTQKNMSLLILANNALSESSVNQILADCVASLSISGRVTCVLNLTGGSDIAGRNNNVPTGQGILDLATLRAAGWSVSTN